MSNIDLHSHVVPPNLIAAMQRDPARFGATSTGANGIKVAERNGKLCWETNGRLTEIERVLFDVDAKIAEMDRMRIDISGVSVAPPTYFYELSPEAGIEQIGADRAVIGSDNPFDMGYRDPLAELDTVPNLAAQEKEQICGRTTRILLGEG